MIATTHHSLIRSYISRYGVTAIAAASSSQQHLVESMLLRDNRTTTSLTTTVYHPQKRHLVSRASIGSDPLDVLRKECAARKRCDEEGRRLKTVDHWSLSIAMASPEKNVPPNLRTISIERVSSDGIDFVMKSTSPASISAIAGLPVSIMYQEGKFLPGQSAEQWRGEGYCETIPLEDIVHLVPLFTKTSMIASCRINDITSSPDAKVDVSEGRMAMISKSRTTEVMQTTRNGLENNTISMDEMKKCMTAFRFKPTRLEYMHGGPDTVMWDRWEWLYNKDRNCWAEPKHLIPH